MPGMSETEQRIRRLCMSCTDLQRVVRKARDDTGALYQGVMAVASRAGGKRGCDVVVTGSVVGANYGLGIPGVSVPLYAYRPSLVLIGNGITDSSGDFSISGTLDPAPPPPSSAYGYEAILSLPPRWVDFNAIDHGPRISCGSNALGVIANMVAESGYEETPICPEPLPDTLTLTDSLYGTVTLTSTSAGFAPPIWLGTKVSGPLIIRWTFKPATPEPGMLVVTLLAGGVSTCTSSSSTIGCGPFSYSGTGTKDGIIYPAVDPTWDIAE